MNVQAKQMFRQLMHTATRDSSEFIRDSAERLNTILLRLSKGEISMEVAHVLLKRLEREAEARKIKEKVEIATRIQAISLRLMDIALNVLLKSVPGVGISATLLKELLIQRD